MRGESRPPGRSLAVMRLSLGAAAIVAPRVLARAFGIDPERNPAGPAIGRLFGIRNIALGLALLRAEEPERERWLSWSVPIDAGDATVVLAGRARGYLSARTAVTGVLAALVAVAAAVTDRQR